MRGVVLYEGPSQLDGAPIVVIATFGSSNTKTGPVAQTWIMRSDQNPVEAAKAGEDAAVCGDCRHRPVNGNTCYVLLWQAPTAVWKSYKAGQYPKLTPALAAHLRSLPLRLGAYGDPAAVPLAVWRKVAGSKALGYTHQWRTAPEFQDLCMASVDSPAEFAEAHSAGWRTFRVKRSDDPMLKQEITCPATRNKGATFCLTCLRCDGTRRGPGRSSIVVDVHGPRAKRFLPVLAG